MQNGVRLTQRLNGLASGPVVPSVVYCGVEMVEPGVVEHRSYGFLEVQEGGLADNLAEVFGPDQQEIHPVADVAYASWSKLVSNAAVNSITALTCRRVDVLHDPGVAELASAVMAESVAVARAEGVDLPVGTAESVLTRLLGLPQYQGSSMLYDRLAGRPLEHEALIGAVVSIGVEHGVPTPASAMLLALLRSVSGRPVS